MQNDPAPAPDRSKARVNLALRRGERDMLGGAEWRALGLDAVAFPIISPALRAETNQPIQFIGERWKDAVAELDALAAAINRKLEVADRVRGPRDPHRASPDDNGSERDVIAARCSVSCVDAIRERVIACAAQLGMEGT